MKPVEPFIAPQSVRIIAGTLLPGLAALGPYFALAYSRFSWLGALAKSYPWAIVASILTISYLGGLLLSSLSCQIEEWIVKAAFKDEKEKEELKRAWHNYLASNPTEHGVLHKYVGQLVTWLKFYTSMIPAAFAFIFGLHIHNFFFGQSSVW
jgi:hypothetical protein